MQKITHICLCGPVTDGFNYQDNLLPKYHKELGYEVSIITSHWIWNEKGKIDWDKRNDYFNEYNIRVIRLASNKNNFCSKFKRFNGLFETLEKEKPDILFIHGCQFLDVNVIVSFIKKYTNVIVYVDNHADFSNSGTNWLSRNVLHRIIWRYTANQIAPYTTKFYGVLPARVDWLIEMYKLPKEKCELLVMGADDDKVKEANDPLIREEIRKKYGIQDDDFLIMTGGKIDAAKTQTLLLMDAVAKIENPKVKLVVFGSVTEDLKEKLKDKCVNNKIIYIGWIKSSYSYKYFSSADLVVFPGRHSVFWEQVAGLGIPMICKYWLGTTHIDLGGNVEFIKENTITEINKKIEELINNPEKLRKMRQVAEKKGKEFFSYRKIAEKSLLKISDNQ